MSDGFSNLGTGAADADWRQRGQKAFEWLVSNYRRMILALALFLVAMAGLLFALEFAARQDQKAAVLFQLAEEAYRKAAPRLPSATPAQGGKAVLAPAIEEAAWRVQQKEAAEKFAAVSRDYPRSHLAPLADLYQAVLWQESGDLSKAVVWMEKALPRLTRDSAAYLLGAQRLGLIYLDRQEYPKAADWFHQLAKNQKAPLRDHFLYWEGEALRQMGKLEEAKDRYLLVEKFEPHSPLADRASQRLASLTRAAERMP